MPESVILTIVGMALGLLGGILVGVWKIAGRLAVALKSLERVEKTTSEHGRMLGKLKLRCVSEHGHPEELSESA